MDSNEALREAVKMLPTIVEIVGDLLAAGRTPEEIIAHVTKLGPAARLDVEAVAVDEARKIREGR